MLATRAILLVLSAFLCSCEDKVAIASAGESSPGETGAVAFLLSPDEQILTSGTSDSVRLELHRGSVARSVSVPWDRPVCLDGIEPGVWSVRLGLYKSDGQLAWLGSDSLKVFGGEVASVHAPLRNASGTVDSLLRPVAASLAPERSLVGQWMFHQLGNTPIVGATAEIELTDSGKIGGILPCGILTGTFQADPVGLGISPSGDLSTCSGGGDSALGRSILAALAATRGWTIAQGHLFLRDGAGGILARLETYPTRRRSRAAVDTLRAASSLDSTGLRIGMARIQSIPSVTDSVILLDLQLPRQGSQVRLVALAGGDQAPACGSRTWPAPDLARILVLETFDPSTLYATVMEQVQVAVRWRDLPRRVRFQDKSGMSLEVERP